MGLFRRPKSPYWWGTFKLEGKPRVQFSTEVLLKDKKKAKIVFDNKRQDAIDTGKLGLPSKITVLELLMEHLKLRVNDGSYRTMCSSVKAINAFMGNDRVCELTPRRIKTFRIWRLSHRNRNGIFIEGIVSNLTVNRDLDTLSAAINENKKELNLRDNPCDDVKDLPTAHHKRSVTYSTEQIDNFVNALKPIVRLLCIFKMSHAMRLGEIRNLKWTQFDFEKGIIYAHKNKEGKPKVVVIHADGWRVVREIEDRIQKGIVPRSEYVFTNDKGEKLTEMFLRWDIKRVRKAKNMPSLRLNDLRHVFGTDMAEDASILAASKAMNHSSVRVTEIYVDSGIKYLKEQVAKKRSRYPKNSEKSSSSATPDYLGIRFSRN